MFDIALATVSLTVPGLGWLLLSPRIAEPLYRPALFSPLRFPKGEWNTDWLGDNQPQDMFFSNQIGSKLHGWLFERSGAKCTIIVNHGKTGNITDLNMLITLLLRAPVNLFVYDYSGFGKSEGQQSVFRVCEDAVAAYDCMFERFPNTQIIEYGESLGGSVAAFVAQRRNVAGLILQSAFFDMRRIAGESYAFFKLWPKLLFPLPYFDVASALKKLNCPVLIVHGAKDVDVVVAHAHDLFAVAKEPKQLVLLANTEHEQVAQADVDTFAHGIAQFLIVMDSEPAPHAVPMAQAYA